MPIPQSKAITNADSSKITVTIENDYEARLEEWESIQSKILIWFINTSCTCKLDLSLYGRVNKLSNSTS